MYFEVALLVYAARGSRSGAKSTGGEGVNALVCKTSIRRFNSGPVLHKIPDLREETKTASSRANLPLHLALADLLRVWRTKCEFEWVFANPATGMPYQSPSIPQRWIRPAGEAIGVEGLDFHSLRHSYRSWLDSAGIAPGVTKDLMRHSAISTTFNVYGKALSPEKREANRKVVEMLLIAHSENR